MIIKGKIGSVFRTIYVYWWLHCINRRKLKINLLTRKDRGYPDCKDCGVCCISCSCWDIDTKLCKIWDDTIITQCRSYPVTPCQVGGINPKRPKICRYYWGEEKYTPTREEVKEMIAKRIAESKKNE